jgi:hypothetical protein
MTIENDVRRIIRTLASLVAGPALLSSNMQGLS